jgi:RNA polymerase sigma factor (sigma-70 family)
VEAIKYRDKLVARAAKMVGSQAEDVVSDLMVYFIEGRFNAPANALPLLMWYVNKRSIDYIKRRQRENKMLRDMHYIGADESLHDDRIEGVETKMHELHPMIARLLVLHYAEGMTLKEIESKTGIKDSRLEYLVTIGKHHLKYEQQD